MCWNVFIQGCHLEEEIDLFTASKDQKLAICRAKDGPTFSAINQLECKYFRPCGLQQPLNFTIVTWKYSQMIHKLRLLFSRSVSRALCNPRDCCTPGFPILYHLPEPAQTHIHWVSDAIQHLILCWPLLLLPSVFPSIRATWECWELNSTRSNVDQWGWKNSINTSASSP